MGQKHIFLEAFVDQWGHTNLPSPRRLRWSGGRNESYAFPHRPVSTGVRVLPDLSGVLQSSQDNDIAHVLERDLHILEIIGKL